MAKTVNNWVTLQNGELILFLHQHLPFLQAKTHHEFNGLGQFLQLLDFLITSKFKHDDTNPHIYIPISKKEFAEFGSAEHYKSYINSFFIANHERDKRKIMEHKTYIFLKQFILDAQVLLIEKLGQKNCFKPLKINLVNPQKIKVCSVPFKTSTILDKIFFKNFIDKVGVQEAQYAFIDKTAQSSVLLTNKQDLSYYEHGLSARQIRDLPEDKKIYTFEVKRLGKTQPYKPKIPTAKQRKETINTHIRINNIELDKMLAAAVGLDAYILCAIKIHYSGNSNYLFYEEKKHRLYATAKINTAPLLQGLLKETRKKLFTGFYQYDLTAAAPTILHQLYEKLCDKKKLPAIKAYIADRNSLRGDCANHLLRNHAEAYKDFNKAKTDVKELITAIFYGGNPLNKQSNVEMFYTTRVSLMQNNTGFKALAEEAKEMFDKLYEVIAKNIDAGGNILYDSIKIDPYKKKLDTKGKKIKRSKASVLSEIYFYHERQILNIAIRQFPNILLLVHDGFIIEQSLDYHNLERTIEQELGLMVKYEEEIL
ncbi:hypothetical protein KKG72_01645 [bacterium]|nr:hypothetical protein [bacterium]MBU1993184.1 hypothetical protein [bacterium]